MKRMLLMWLLLLCMGSMYAQIPSLFPQRVKDKYGFVDVNGIERLKFMFDEVTPFSEGYAYVVAKPWKGYVRANGTWAFYDTLIVSAEPMKQGIAVIRKTTGTGAADSSGKIIVPYTYSFLKRFDQLNILLAYKTITENNAKRDIIHLYTFAGLKVPVDFDRSVNQDDACVVGMKQNGKLWLYGRDAKPLLGYQVDDLYATPHGARIKLNNLYGAINRQGKLVLPIRYKKLWISEWQAYADFSTVAGDTSAYMNLDNGKIAFTFRSINPQPVSDDVAVISYINNVHNVHDLSGKRIAQLITHEDTSRDKTRSYIQAIFHMHYSDGIIAIRHADRKYYAYNKQGKLVFPKGYEAEFTFANGVAIVRTNGYSFEYGLINKAGKEILPLEYSNIYRSSERDILRIAKDGKEGLVRTDGTIVVPLQPIYLEDKKNGFFFMQGNYTTNGVKLGYLNTRTGLLYFDPNDK